MLFRHIVLDAVITADYQSNDCLSTATDDFDDYLLRFYDIQDVSPWRNSACSIGTDLKRPRYGIHTKCGDKLTVSSLPFGSNDVGDNDVIAIKWGHRKTQGV